MQAKPTLDRRVQAGAGEGGADVAEGGGEGRRRGFEDEKMETLNQRRRR